ncbi:uncharacterized protein LOC115393388 [Salarias fasciatus]|uniref:uncharacterized protein LOC115393388 n=1 Tax=Salarias fasciatus TaxID=181472 RepID=UPI0011769C9D|nr:uncharacterized protein LOC115393388 [Salarias fasciatus]
MEPSAGVVGLDAQGNMVFTVVKPVVGIFQGVHALSDHASVLPPGQSPAPAEHSQAEMQRSEPAQSKAAPASSSGSHMPFAEVSSLLDPNMKGSKARKYLVAYDEIKRRLQAPEKMSLRSLAAYTRVSRGPASKKALLESLGVLGLTPSTTTAVSSSFSKLTEGDTRALCDDMKDFAQDYIDYSNMAKQLIPDSNMVQHWSKIIESKNHLEDMRKCFRDPANSGAFDSVTHGLGLGMLDVALDMVVAVIEQQIRILSGAAAAADPADSGPPARRVRRRHRRARPADGETSQRAGEGVAAPGRLVCKGKSRARAGKAARREAGGAGAGRSQADSNVLTLVSVGYEAVSGGLNVEGSV